MDAPLFNAARFEAALQTADIGRTLVYRTTVETTMTVARDAAASGAAHGTLILAEEQTAGRGRRGRGFHSPPGENLYFTLVLRLAVESHRRFPLLVPLAVCEAVRGLGLEARIKWPNDIWVGERKVSGMLIDAEAGPAGLVAFPGIGINVNGDPTVIAELRETATSIRRELGGPTDREALLAAICNALEAAIALPPAEAAARYRVLSMILGRRVVISPTAGPPYDARAESIADDGTLLVVRDSGERLDVHAADVSVRPR